MKTNYQRGFKEKYSKRHKAFFGNKAIEYDMDKTFSSDANRHSLGTHIDVAWKRGAKKNIRQRRRYYEHNFCRKQMRSNYEI
ncbi:hypothetical protein [uncultured Arcobacter sp.]|mgnify:CR=1 FL=1|uniref:hypothetical protein n=1 Tax=uncultured Arcobacter sp. TaxID=165434 RepID=UPI00262D712D|nr:hypothetical protein [uncultured Arcobacter sp.]